MKCVAKKLTAFVLAVSTLLCLTLTGSNGAESDPKGEEVYSSDGVYILCEEKERRGAYEKHYVTSDGNFIAVSYPEQIHYMDENGKYLDIDCTLEENGGNLYSHAGSFLSVFPERLNSGSVISVSDKESTLKWSVSALNAEGRIVNYSESVAEIIENNIEKNDYAYINDMSSFDLPNLTSTVRYSNIFDEIPGVDAVYTVSYNKVEEDIVLNRRNGIDSLVVTVQTGCQPQVNENGSVSFLNKDGESEFCIGSPYMYDSEDGICSDIKVTAEPGDGYCTVKYSLNKDWLEDESRAYPVTFDPSITTKEYSSNIVDTYVRQNTTNDHSSETRIYVGLVSGNINRTYIRVNNLPDIDPSCPILSANLTLKIYSTTTTGKAVSLYKVNGSWNPTTIKYSNQPSGTYLSSCSFNASNLYYTLDLTSDFTNLYDEYLSASNYGYMVRYTDESNTNPDWNSMYSMEYTSNTSYRPIFTVVYGYTLPEGLTNGGVYAFQNLGSASLMSVHNGLNANDTNVYQKSGGPQNATTAQKFKLDAVSSTGGYYLRAMCSSNGTGKVLDIYKTNGFVENGCNVQIYTANDPLAQHWLIVPAGGIYFKIIPRTNMSLALTAYGNSDGTANGTTSTSAGNIFVSEYTGSDYQKWFIYDCVNNTGVSAGTGSVSNNTYYFNNSFTGKYLHKNTNTAANTSSGLVSTLGNTIRWKITNQYGNLYTVQSSSNLSLYLNHTSSNTVSLLDCSGYGNIPDSCLWKIQQNTISYDKVSNNVTTTYYLSNSGATLSLVTSRGSSGSEAYKKTTWRMASVDYYSGRELNSGFSVSDMVIDVGETKTPTINKSPSNALWAEYDDFVYTSSNAQVASVNNGSNSIVGMGRGYATITATHKITNRTSSFDVFVKNYCYSESIKDDVREAFENYTGEIDVHIPGYDLYTVETALEVVLSYDTQVTTIANTFKIPKEFIQSIFFKEVLCYDLGDASADTLVQEYYNWLEGNGSQPLVIHTDSSTGLCQIFAVTAINAINNAYDRGFVTLNDYYDENDWHDVWYVWQQLHNNNDLNIMYCALVILDCQYIYAFPYINFFEYSESQIKLILSRYNGTGSESVTYGDICYGYYSVFESFNNG